MRRERIEIKLRRGSVGKVRDELEKRGHSKNYRTVLDYFQTGFTRDSSACAEALRIALIMKQQQEKEEEKIQELQKKDAFAEAKI